ncbi:uncharacterized protein LOC143299476 [Babylonia areolata]|uniref:uncharacterized protein LOC143299476 n=1 Tax=Babylonia areolata TaxID=304850 RepID=UPI003FD55736
MVVAASKPAALLAGALTSPGTLNAVLLFTLVAVAELLLNDAIFVCPCHSNLIVPYGLSFFLLPAFILFLADFPWKLVRGCPPPNIMCSLIRRPSGLALTWVIIGSLQRRYLDCLTLGPDQDGCERSVTATYAQLVALYVWLLIIVFTIVLVLCRRRKMSCIAGRSKALEMQIMFEIEEKRDKMVMEKTMKYGVTDTKDEELSLEALGHVQQGLTPHTYSVLRSEQLLQPRVLRFLRPEDLLSLDISVAQRCLLRNLLSTLERNPDLWTTKRCHEELNKLYLYMEQGQSTAE